MKKKKERDRRRRGRKEIEEEEERDRRRRRGRIRATYEEPAVGPVMHTACVESWSSRSSWKEKERKET